MNALKSFTARGLANRLPFYYGWVVVAIAFVTMGIGVNSRTAFSLLFPQIIDEFGWTRATIAATFSIGFMVSIITTPLAGVLMGRFGPRLVIPMGALLVSSGLVLATFATMPWHFYLTLGAMVVGGSIFMSYIGHTLFLPNWFEHRRGLAIGLAFSGVGVGSITLFPWLQNSILTVGWRESCWIIAAVMVALLVPLNYLFQRYHPHELGLEPDGIVVTGDKDKQARISSIDSRIVDRAWVNTEWTLAMAIRTARFWWLMLSFSSGLYVWYAVQIHQTRYLIDVGMTPQTAALALGLVGFSSITGQVAIGYFSDRVGREWGWSVAILGFMLTYVFLYFLRIWPSEWLMYLMVGVQGFLGYGLASIYGVVPAEIFSGKRYGVIFGVIGAGSGIGAAIGPWATGLFYDQWGIYDQAFGVAIAVCALSIISMWMAAPRHIRLVAGRARKTDL